MPVSVPFLVTTSVAVLGAITGPLDDDEVPVVTVGAVGAVGAVVTGGVVWVGRRSLHAVNAIATIIAAEAGKPMRITLFLMCMLSP